MSTPAVVKTTPAPAPKPASRSQLLTSMIPGCCGLKVVRVLSCLGKTDALSKQIAEEFDKQVLKGTADDGNWNTYGKALETIAIISTSNRYHVNDPEQKEFKRQVKFLKDKGWICLASWLSMESGGTNYMWGSKGIKAGEVSCDR